MRERTGMEESLRRKVERLKDELAKKKEEVHDIAELVRKEIDRYFQLDPQELSDRELEAFIQEKLRTYKGYIDINPDPGALTSHRKILGRPILFLKRKFMKMIRFYTQLITLKQTKFNENSAALLEAVLARSRRNKQELEAIEARISRLEETVFLLTFRLRELKENLRSEESRAGVITREEK